MTATRDHSAAYDTAPSLDGLLKAATPVDAEPFDLGELLDDIEEFDGRLSNTYDRDAVFAARRQIARYINDLRCTIDAREHTAANLEADAARVDRKIAEAVALLSDALLWHSSETDNTAVAVQEALALLTGDAS